MTRKELAAELVKQYPRTTMAYWLKYDKAVLQLNYDAIKLAGS
jgi:hypothetical protein